MRIVCMKSFIVQKSVVNVLWTRSIEQNWANIFSDLRDKQIDIPNFNKILGIVLNFPGSNAHTEKILSLMSNKWTDKRNQSNVELIESDLMVANNYDENLFPSSGKTYLEFRTMDKVQKPSDSEEFFRYFAEV
jgi:hypothetical protein